MAKRGNGEGSIYQRKEDGKWVGSITLENRKRKVFYTKKEDEGLASTTIHYYHSVLHNALNVAVKWGLISKNVCDLVSSPREERYEIKPLTVEQAQTLLATARGHKWEALFALALA